jgi:hypothetical protein
MRQRNELGNLECSGAQGRSRRAQQFEQGRSGPKVAVAKRAVPLPGSGLRRRSSRRAVGSSDLPFSRGNPMPPTARQEGSGGRAGAEGDAAGAARVSGGRGAALLRRRGEDLAAMQSGLLGVLRPSPVRAEAGRAAGFMRRGRDGRV